MEAVSKRHLRWLYGELPSLVADGLLTEEAANSVRDRYGPVKEVSGRRIALTACSILGSALVGSGIILLLAHNWTQMGRAARTVLSLSPLVVAQLVALSAAWTGRRTAAWREGTATLLSLSVGSSIALVGQTYHIPGDLGSFLLAWSLLVLPLVYLLDATLPFLLYCVGITAWSGYEQSSAGQAMLFWPLFALVLPSWWAVARGASTRVPAILRAWVICFCLCVATGITLEKGVPGLWILVYCGLFASFALAGARWERGVRSAMQKPFLTVGTLGTVVIALLFTYEFAWDDIGWNYYRYDPRHHAWACWPDYVLAAVLPCTAIALLVGTFRRGERVGSLFGAMPIVTLVAFSLAAVSDSEIAPVIIFNLYLLALGVWTVAHGIRTRRLGMVNGGMAILAALIVARFFDSEFGFVIRGVMFIVLGVGFLGVNILLARRTKGAA